MLSSTPSAIDASRPIADPRGVKVRPGGSREPVIGTKPDLSGARSESERGGDVERGGVERGAAGHEPRNVFERVVAKVTDKLAPKIVTRESEMWTAGGDVFGVEFGFTASQLQLVKKHTGGLEVNSMQGDGHSSIELLLARKQIGAGHRVELQGPALQASVAPGEQPLAARFVGVDITNDVVSGVDHQAVSYTIEVKITDKTLLELAADVGAGTAAKAAELLLQNAAGENVAHAVGHAILGAVPIVSGVLAVLAVRRAIRVVRNHDASGEMKAFAVAHAAFDTVRVFVPLAGAIGGALLVGVALGAGYVHVKHAKHEPILSMPILHRRTT
jgi:hypothetical protein